MVAYPGGTSSSFLLGMAADVLGRKAMAITARSPLFPDQPQRQRGNPWDVAAR